MKTILKSKVLVLDERYMTFIDFSQYNADIPVTGAIYKITLPNFNKYVEVPYTAGHVLNVNSNLLKLTDTIDLDGLCPIPGGLFKIVQSVCPNDKVYFEFNFFNVEPALTRIAQIVCAETDGTKLDRLFTLKNRLEEVKIMAETCCREKEAISLYNATFKEIARLGEDCAC